MLICRLVRIVGICSVVCVLEGRNDIGRMDKGNTTAGGGGVVS